MSRLKPGEVAPSVAARQGLKIKSVKQLIATFREALEKPQEIPAEVLEAFRSYRRLAHWKCIKRKIEPMAENTLRKHLEALYEGGLINFERDRLRLLEDASKYQIRSGTKMAYKQASDNLQVENQILVNQILQFSAQYLDLLETISDLSPSHPALNNALKAHVKRYPNAFRGLQLIQGGKDEH